MDSFSVEFRAEVLSACDRGEMTHDVALRFGVSKSWVRRIKQQRRETGQIGPKTAAPRQAKWRAWSEWLVAKLTAQLDIYLRELQAAPQKERGEEVCLATLCNACRALKRSRKKRR